MSGFKLRMSLTTLRPKRSNKAVKEIPNTWDFFLISVRHRRSLKELSKEFRISIWNEILFFLMSLSQRKFVMKEWWRNHKCCTIFLIILNKRCWLKLYKENHGHCNMFLIFIRTKGCVNELLKGTWGNCVLLLII